MSLLSGTDLLNDQLVTLALSGAAWSRRATFRAYAEREILSLEPVAP